MGSMFQKQTADTPMPAQTSYDAPTSDTVETVVGPSVHVEGDFVSEGNMVVKGSVKGSVKTSQLLTVEEGAKIVAEVHAGQAIVSGIVEGNINASDRLELTQTAQILGNISCATLVVAPGALLHGNVSMHEVEQPVSAPRKMKKVEEDEDEDYDEDDDE